MNETEIVFDDLFKKVAFHDDEHVFSVLFIEFYPSLCVFAMRLVNQEEVARDIVQDVFFNVWKGRKSTFVSSSFRNFLITSVRNHCVDYLRRQNVYITPKGYRYSIPKVYHFNLISKFI